MKIRPEFKSSVFGACPSSTSSSFSSSPSPLHPLVAAVDVEAVVAEEADEGDSEGGSEFNGQAGGSAHGADELDAGHGGFLEELEARASA
jgi:hypothetical protein